MCLALSGIAWSNTTRLRYVFEYFVNTKSCYILHMYHKFWHKQHYEIDTLIVAMRHALATEVVLCTKSAQVFYFNYYCACYFFCVLLWFRSNLWLHICLFCLQVDQRTMVVTISTPVLQELFSKLLNFVAFECTYWLLIRQII